MAKVKDYTKLTASERTAIQTRNRRITIITIVVGVLLTAMAFGSGFLMKGTVNNLEKEHRDLLNQLASLEKENDEEQAKQKEEEQELIRESFGIDTELIEIDKREAKRFFEPAFDWKSSDAYDSARERYLDVLGKDNSFTNSYMPPNVKIDTMDGELSLISFHSLKSELKEFRVVPLFVEGDRIRYAGFVTHIMHTDKKDLVNPDVLSPSSAIVKFTVYGNIHEGERKVDEVEAWSGFVATPIESKR